jgi:hypothetical protein
VSSTDQLDDVYRERAHLVAHLAAVYPSVLVYRADPDAPDWPVIFIRLPAGQVSWHVNPEDLDLFDHVNVGTETWDGHTTDEKYARLDAHTRALTQKEA